MRTVDEVRTRLTERLDRAVRRTGLWTNDSYAHVFFRLLLEDLAFVDRVEEELATVLAACVDDRGLRSSIGVRGAAGRSFLPDASHSGLVGSVMAEIGHRLGWVTLDRVVPAERWEEARAALTGLIATNDVIGADVIRMWGGASFTGLDVAALVSDDGRWLFADFHTLQLVPAAGAWRHVNIEEAWLRNVRLPTPNFADGLRFSPSGRVFAKALPDDEGARP